MAYEGKRRGPKVKFKIDEIIEQVKVLAGREFNQKEMAAYFGMSETYWHELRKKYPDFDILCQQQIVITNNYCTGKLLDLIRKGDAKAIIHWDKTRRGYCEKNTTINIQQSPAELTIDTKDPVEISKRYTDFMKGQ